MTCRNKSLIRQFPPPGPHLVKITRIELSHVRLPLRYPYEISSGVMRQKDAIVVKMTAEGLVGYGESSPLDAPFYSYETVGTCWHVLTRFIVPRLVGMEIASAEELLDRLGSIRGHFFA